jgi:Fe-S-cluster containining protein
MSFDCSKCPGFCCSYPHIPVSDADVRRLGRHFGIPAAEAEARFTKRIDGERAMRHKKDPIYKSMCMHFDQKARKCTIYTGRPYVCRKYPCGDKCGYFDFLMFERELQGDEEYIPGI